MPQLIRQLSPVEAHAKGVRGVSVTGSSDAPVVQIAQHFTYQSYFDSTLQETAILAQRQGEPIVDSTKQAVSVGGYALALHPSSQTPIAVRFQKGGQQGDSTTYILKPGQVIRPVGFTGADQRFSGFEYGLPFGWLGGGNVTLLVLRSPDAQVEFIDRNEVLFHRTRMPILALAGVPAAGSLPFNWPTGFPWGKAYRDTVPQQGQQSILSVTPTRVAMALRSGTLAAPATMRAYFIGTTDFHEISDGTVALTEAVAYDVVWPTWASLASANFATQYPFQFLTPEMVQLSANSGAMVLVEASPGTLAGTYVDVVRYGVL